MRATHALYMFFEIGDFDYKGALFSNIVIAPKGTTNIGKDFSTSNYYSGNVTDFQIHSDSV